MNNKKIAVAIFISVSVALGATAAISTGLIDNPFPNNTNSTIPIDPVDNNNTLPEPVPQPSPTEDNDDIPEPDFYNGTCGCWYIHKK